MVEFRHESGEQENDGLDPGLEERFEQELRASLQPRPAPEGFADRVLARVEELHRRNTARWRLRSISNPAVRGAIAALLLLAIGIGGYFERQRERHIAGERARQQVLLALQITSTTIRDVRKPFSQERPN